MSRAMFLAMLLAPACGAPSAVELPDMLAAPDMTLAAPPGFWTQCTTSGECAGYAQDRPPGYPCVGCRQPYARHTDNERCPDGGGYYANPEAQE